MAHPLLLLLLLLGRFRRIDTVRAARLLIRRVPNHVGNVRRRGPMWRLRLAVAGHLPFRRCGGGHGGGTP